MNRFATAAALAVLAAGAAACGGSGSGANNSSGTTEGSANAAAGSPAAPQNGEGEGEVRALLEQIYAPYATDDAPGREIAGLMEPQLAQAMARLPEGINADPFIDAQDYEAFTPIYQSVRVNGDRAEAAVRINSMGERTIDYQFVRVGDEWKIADVRSAHSGSLRSQYRLPPLP